MDSFDAEAMEIGLDELLDLVDQAFLEGLIDGVTASLSTYWAEANLAHVH